MGITLNRSKVIRRVSKLSSPVFPLSDECQEVIKSLKKDTAGSLRALVDPSPKFTVETDASDNAVGAVLSQSGWLVAFFSRTQDFFCPIVDNQHLHGQAADNDKCHRL